jgi:hypothetical protein
LALTSLTANSAALLPLESPTALSSITRPTPCSLFKVAPTTRFRAKIGASLSLQKMIFLCVLFDCKQTDA